MGQVAPKPLHGQRHSGRAARLSPLVGKSVLIVEDEPLIAVTVECGLREAGAAVVKLASSIASAKGAIDEGRPFDAAVVDLHLADSDANSLIEVLSERGIPVVATTGGSIDQELYYLSRAVAILRNPHFEGNLIEVIAWLMK